MNRTGIVSISFRDKTPEEIICAAIASGLDSVEWGGDVHVPHGNKETAKRVRDLTESAGLAMPEYGSYYIIGTPEKVSFSDVLLSADTLGCEAIRVWPGMNCPSDSITNEQYRAFVEDARRICDEGKDHKICLECHPKSLTDEYHTAIQLIKDIDRENLLMFWQPNQFKPPSYNFDSLHALLPFIYSAHVFSWERDAHYPLEKGKDAWSEYINILSSREINYMLEFMHDNKIESLPEAARTLKGWLKI